MEDIENICLEILGERDFLIFQEMINRLRYENIVDYFHQSDNDHEKALKNPIEYHKFNYRARINALIEKDNASLRAILPIKFKGHQQFFDQNAPRIFKALDYGLLAREFSVENNDIEYLENRALMYEAYYAYRISLGEIHFEATLKYIKSLLAQEKNKALQHSNQKNIEITNQLSIQNFDQRLTTINYITNNSITNNYYSTTKNEESIKIQFPSTGNIELLHVFFVKLFHLGFISSLELFIAPFKGKLFEGHKSSRWQADNTALIFLIELLGKKGIIRVPLNRSKAIRLCFLDIDGNEFKENSLNSLASSKRIMSLSKENPAIENFVKNLGNNDVTLIFETFKTVYSS